MLFGDFNVSVGVGSKLKVVSMLQSEYEEVVAWHLRVLKLNPECDLLSRHHLINLLLLDGINDFGISLSFIKFDI